MLIKQKLKERLLEIPINHRAFREKHRLVADLQVDFKKVEFYLNELVQLGILIEKKQYIYALLVVIQQLWMITFLIKY